MSIKRRRRVLMAAGAAGGVALCGLTSAFAQVHVSEADPMAQALNYRDNAAKVDKSNTRYLAGSACANCQLYQGKPGDPAGNCPIFQKLVSAQGWCNSYVKKA